MEQSEHRAYGAAYQRTLLVVLRTLITVLLISAPYLWISTP